MQDTFLTTSDWLIAAASYLLNALAVLAVGRFAFNYFNKHIKVGEELFVRDNFAFALTVVGYYTGLIIAFGGALSGEPIDLVTDAVNHSIYGLMAVVLLNISRLLTDRFILFRFHVEHEIIVDRNAGTGVVEFANYIASGCIIYGALSGEVMNWFPQFVFGQLLSAVGSVLIFWALGQLVLIIATRVYYKMLPYHVHDLIESDNVAAGISFAGVLIAIGILVGHGISGDFYSWSEHLTQLAVEGIAGIILLPVIRFITDKVLVPGESLSAEIANQEIPNKGAALIEALAYTGGAFLLVICL